MDELLERDFEIGELAGALSGAQEGRGRIVLVQGPAGLGKTSLLAAATAMAGDRGFACQRARATELEHEFAYGCVRQLLETVVARAPDPERMFRGAAGLAQPLFAPFGAAPSAPSADNTFAMLHGLYWLVGNLVDDGPLVLVVDDIHWSDPESVRFFNYLAPRLDGLALAVLASTRSGESMTPDLARLAAGPETTVLEPRPLSTGATARLCRSALGDEVASEFAVACREATGGNPFYLDALLREVGDRDLAPDAREVASIQRIGPAAVAESVRLRLSDRPAAATALVRAVAILGDGVRLADAARLAELGEDEASGAGDLLATLAILDANDGLAFTHPIVREAVYAGIGAHERAEAHARAAAILADGGAPAERIAAQIVAAEPTGDPARVDLLRRVAADALTRGAPAGAVTWLKRALAEPPPAELEGDVLVELSFAQLRVGAPGEAVEPLQAAIRLIDQPTAKSRAVRLLGAAFTWSGQADRAVEAIGSGIEAVEAHDREVALLLEADRAGYAQQGSLEARAPVVPRLESLGRLTGATLGERLVLASLAFERARASESEQQAAAHLEHALADGRLLDEQGSDVAGTLYLLVVGLLATDALDLAQMCVERMLADATARASIPAQGFVLVHRGWVALRKGSVNDAEADARTTLELLTAQDIRLGTHFALALLIETLIEGGQVDEAEQALRDYALDDEIQPGMADNDLLAARGDLRIALGQTREGVDDLVEFGRRDELWGGANTLASRWRSRAALALAAAGDGDRAARLAAEDLERARRWGAASGLGVALRAVGLIDGIDERLAEAVDALAGSPARLEHARAQTDLGAALRRAGRRTDARGLLEDGLRQAQRSGARALAERARTELLAAGGRSSDPEGSGVEQLTASERRVAELAAQGHSNPEIAQALFVTRKTIETHLGHVYQKLGLSGRGELSRALAD